MKARIIFGFLLLSIASYSKGRTDTVRCGDFIAYGKIVKGKKEGIWHYKKKDRGYYSDVAEGVYSNGKKTGEWYIYSNGRQLVHYKNDTLDGAVTIYDYRGTVVGKGNYENGLRDGEWNYYHNNYDRTGISSIQHYHQGHPVGTWKYFPYSERRYSCYSGEMNSFGKNGYWIRIDSIFVRDPHHPEGPLKFVRVVRDSAYFIDGRPEGFFDDIHGKGKYVNGKKEGWWLNRHSYGNEVVEYKNGLREGYDTLHDFGQFQVAFFSKDKPNGPMAFYERPDRLIAKGQAVPNPLHDFEHSTIFPVPIPAEVIVDLIENGIGDSRLFEATAEYRIFEGYGPWGLPPVIFPSPDSLIVQLKHSEYITYNDSPYSKREEALTGHWIYYDRETLRKKAEGSHTPIVYNSIVWDSTNQIEDPYNRGTFILVPVKTDKPIYAKTGWWNYYDGDEVLIRKERYDENGKLTETKDTLGLGYHCNYWQNGNKREEGFLTPITYEQVYWDSTHQEEDPLNPGTYILVPKLIEQPAYYKSGWWKIYDEQGKLIREEQYDVRGYGEIIGEKEYDAEGKLIREASYSRWGDLLEEKKY